MQKQNSMWIALSQEEFNVCWNHLTSDVPPWVRFILLYDHSVFVSCNIFGRLIECPDPPEGKNDVRGDSGDKTDRNWAAPSLVTISSHVIFRYHRSIKSIVLNREFNQIA